MTQSNSPSQTTSKSNLSFYQLIIWILFSFMNFLFSDLPEQDIFGSFFDSVPQPAAEVAYSNTQQLNPDSGKS